MCSPGGIDPTRHGDRFIDPAQAERISATEWACGRPARTRKDRAYVVHAEWLQDPAPRRRVSAGLNKGEARNSLARAVFFYRLGEIRDRSYENQRYRQWAEPGGGCDHALEHGISGAFDWRVAAAARDRRQPDVTRRAVRLEPHPSDR